MTYLFNYSARESQESSSKFARVKAGHISPEIREKYRYSHIFALGLARRASKIRTNLAAQRIEKAAKIIFMLCKNLVWLSGVMALPPR